MADVRAFRRIEKTLTPEERHEQTMAKLRTSMQEVQTRAQFEFIVSQATDPAAARRLMEPMLPPDLPCCSVSSPHSSLHHENCPKTLAAKQRVHDEEVARMEAEGAPPCS